MTLGQKLAGYRKLSGVTQQQLGEHLNISAQAISKWEKDISEPALATLRALAEFYKITVDEILDLDSGFADFGTNLNDEKEEIDEEEKKEPAREAQKEEVAFAIGFCKNCGITVTEDNKGTTEPVVLCKKCYEQELLEESNRILKQELLKKKAEEEEAREREKQRKRDEEFAKNKRRKASNRMIWSLSVAGIAFVIFLIIMISSMISDFSGTKLIVTFVLGYVIFAFVSCLFYDCVVSDVVLDWFAKSIQLPGLIFTFDIDGILWLIGMKILFWLIGLIFGIVTGAIGIVLGMICAPFVFPFVINKEKKALI